MSKLSRRAVILSGAVAAAAGRSFAALAVGDEAPDFTLPGSDGRDATLSSFRGKKNVVLAFFPKAFTGGWTREMQGYQAGIKSFTSTDAVVFGVSTDPLETNKKFAESLSLDFAILSDEGGAVSKKFDILNERMMSNRTTFVIDKMGKIVHVESGGEAIDPAGAANACSRL